MNTSTTRTKTWMCAVGSALLFAGCAATPPKYVKAEISLSYPGIRQQPAQVITDEQWIAELVGALPPGVGMGHRSSMGVAGIQSHLIVLTRENGKSDTVIIQSGGAAWSEGRGDWLLGDAERTRLGQMLRSTNAESIATQPRIQ